MSLTTTSNVDAALAKLTRNSAKEAERLPPAPSLGGHPCLPLEFEHVMLGPEKRRAMLEQAEARRNLGGRP